MSVFGRSSASYLSLPRQSATDRFQQLDRTTASGRPPPIVVTEADWHDATKIQPHFAISESPAFVGRAVVALASFVVIAVIVGRAFDAFSVIADVVAGAVAVTDAFDAGTVVADVVARAIGVFAALLAFAEESASAQQEKPGRMSHACSVARVTEP